MGTEEHDTVFKDDEPTTNDHDNNSLSQIDSSTSAILCDPNVNSESNEVQKLSEVVKNFNNTPHIYRQDVVRSKSGMIGIVTEVAGDTDSDGSITDDEYDDEDPNDEGQYDKGHNDEGHDDDENEDADEEQGVNNSNTNGNGDGEKNGEGHDDDENEDADEEQGVNNSNTNGNGDAEKNGGSDKSGPLPADQARVLWMDETESTQNITDLTVVDRGFLHGDFVAAASDPTGQVGVVVDVNISVDLLAPDGSVIKDMSSSDLKRVTEFTVGDYVVLGPWLGKIDYVYDNITVLFDDGSVCRVMRADPLDLKPLSKNMLEDGHFPYYPGQRVRARSSSVFKNARWISGLWKPNRLEGTVSKVTVGSVDIYWIASAGCGPDSSTAPDKEQTPKNLKLLSCFTHANWQWGDWCLFPSVVSSSSIPLDKGLSKLELRDSANSELKSTQMGSGCDSEESVLEESNGNNESMDIDPVSVLDGNNGNTGRNISIESTSCCSSSVSKDTVHETWPLHRKKIRKVVVKRDKKARKEESFQKSYMIVNTRTTVDVAWQDGSTEWKVDSTNLIPLDSPGDHEFVAEQYVVEKASDDGEDACEARRVGLVRSVNAKERTACVRWLKPVSRAEDPREFEKEEVVSVYELEGHPDYDYCYGDVVVRLLPAFVSAQTASEADFVEEPERQTRPSELRSASKEKEDPSNDEACMEFSDLSWVGNITGLKNGDIEVTWADGMVSTVGPQAIYVVGRADDDESIDAGSEVSDAASWETVDADEMNALFHESTEEEVGLQEPSTCDVNSEAEEGEEYNSVRNPALSVPLAALRFVTRLATGIFSRGQKNLDPICLDTKGEEGELEPREVEISQGRDHGEDSSSQKSNVVDICGAETNNGEEEKHVSPEAAETLDAAEILCNLRIDLRTEESDAIECSKHDACSFKRFDIATDPLDHHFLGSAGQNTSGRKWFKKVQQDWSILQNNLPDGICVRVYEDRMDLLRAVIVGAYGTPYQDGLFFFDFHLPPEYPDVPPSAYYHSGGWRINPNLYEEGKVCLSLLNTWTGKGNEVWKSTSSSILQVLVSLQGLVLNSKPYFNEAGYDKQIGTAEGEKNSLSYNENTFLLNCKTMMYLMRRPPRDFEELVKDHFKRRGYYILKACDAYMKGHLIGSLKKDASVSDKSDINSTSVGFKLMLSKIVPRLFLSLSEVGADCHEFKHLQQ